MEEGLRAQWPHTLAPTVTASMQSSIRTQGEAVLPQMAHKSCLSLRRIWKEGRFAGQPLLLLVGRLASTTCSEHLSSTYSSKEPPEGGCWWRGTPGRNHSSSQRLSSCLYNLGTSWHALCWSCTEMLDKPNNKNRLDFFLAADLLIVYLNLPGFRYILLSPPASSLSSFLFPNLHNEATCVTEGYRKFGGGHGLTSQAIICKLSDLTHITWHSDTLTWSVTTG